MILGGGGREDLRGREKGERVRGVVSGTGQDGREVQRVKRSKKNV